MTPDTSLDDALIGYLRDTERSIMMEMMRPSARFRATRDDIMRRYERVVTWRVIAEGTPGCGRAMAEAFDAAQGSVMERTEAAVRAALIVR